jgi:ADP-ribose pyrophosphatase
MVKRSGAMTPAIVSRETVLTTPYFRLVGKRLEGQLESEPHYALEMLDYVSIVALTAGGDLVLVRQFRPAVETVTLELPAGHVEKSQTPEDAARAELFEETGFKAKDVRFLGCLKTDTGRLANRMWVYCAPSVERLTTRGEEPGIEVVVATPGEVSGWLSQGTFDHALHVASIFLAIRAGCMQLPLPEPL